MANGINKKKGKTGGRIKRTVRAALRGANRWVAGMAAALLLFLPCALPARAQGVGGLSSLSAVLYEPESGRILYEKDAHTPRPMASTTKLMTALIALEHCPPDMEIEVTAQAVRVEGSALGLRAGDRITMVDLVTGLLLVSGNDAANVVAYTVAGSIPAFAELMNARAAEIGMEDSTFVTPSGLDEGGHSSSAYDMALLAAEALKNETIASICAMKTAVIRFGNPPRDVTVSNHNKLLRLYPDAIGMKTGFTKKSGRCLVSAARRDGATLIAVTLNGGDYWNDHMALYNYGFTQVESVSLTPPELPALPVAGGQTGQVVLSTQTPPAKTLLAGEKEKLTVKIELPRFLLAPVETGEEVGRVRYLAGERELCSMPVYTASSVAERTVAGYWERLWDYWLEMLWGLLQM